MTTPVYRESPVFHHFTVDVEEAFQVSALEPYVARADWERLPSRVDRNTRILLELMARTNVRGTFFTLGWVAERHGDLVRDIHAAGHEIASHGWGHERVTMLSPAAFRESVASSKAILEDLVGEAVFGYRAPSFSIVRGGEWALDILVECGYRYDSSLYPVRRRGYGFAGGVRYAHFLRRGASTLVELPPATLRVLGATIPAGGGAYLRLLPFAVIDGALRQATRAGCGTTIYLHPWEIDAEQLRLPVPMATRIRHYGGIARVLPRLRTLFQRHRFRPIRETLQVASSQGTFVVQGLSVTA